MKIFGIIYRDDRGKNQKALEIHDTLDLNLEIGEAYLNHGWSAEATAWGEHVIEEYDEEPTAYAFLAKCQDLL